MDVAANRSLERAENTLTYNNLKVAECFRRHAQVTVALAAEETGIPLQTMYRIMRGLLNQGVIKKAQDASGRKAASFVLNDEHSYFMGFTLGIGSVTMGITTLQGDIIGHRISGVDKNLTLDEVLAILDKDFNSLLEEIFNDRDIKKHISMIGIAAMGTVNEQSKIIEDYPQLPCTEGCRLEDIISHRYGIKTMLTSYTVAETFSYISDMTRFGVKSFICLFIGAGIAFKVVDKNSELFMGSSGRVGEVANMILPGTNISLEEQMTTLNLYKEIENFLNTVEENGAERRLSALGEELDYSLGMAQVTERLLQENRYPEVRVIVERSVSRWASLIYYLNVMYDPEAIVITGELDYHTPMLIQMLRNSLAEHFHLNIPLYPTEDENRFYASSPKYYLNELFYEQFRNDGESD